METPSQRVVEYERSWRSGTRQASGKRSRRFGRTGQRTGRRLDEQVETGGSKDEGRPPGSASGKERGTASRTGLRERRFLPEPGTSDGLKERPKAARVNQRR